jgi:hypothetical protein
LAPYWRNAATYVENKSQRYWYSAHVSSKHITLQKFNFYPPMITNPTIQRSLIYPGHSSRALGSLKRPSSVFCWWSHPLWLCQPLNTRTQTDYVQISHLSCVPFFKSSYFHESNFSSIVSYLRKCRTGRLTKPCFNVRSFRKEADKTPFLMDYAFFIFIVKREFF